VNCIEHVLVDHPNFATGNRRTDREVPVAEA
jgi:hypothetical protein